MKPALTIHLTRDENTRRAACGELCVASGALWAVKKDRAFLSYVWEDGECYRRTDLSLPVEDLGKLQGDGHPFVVCGICRKALACVRGWST